MNVPTDDQPWHLATCLQCEPRLAQPFRDKAERDAWAVAHTTVHSEVLLQTDPKVEP